MKKVILRRIWQDKNQATGIITVVRSSDNQPIFASLTVERGDRDNKRGVSNIPVGIYPLRFTYSPKFKRKMWLVDEVPGRSGIRIHPANYWTQLQGCISPGLQLKDLNKDGYYDVTSSRFATKNFERVLKDITETTIEIIDETR